MSEGNDNHQPAPFERKPGGVFVTKGMGVRIPAGGFRISINPAVESAVTLHVFCDVTPTWLDLAFTRVIEAEAGRAELLAALCDAG